MALKLGLIGDKIAASRAPELHRKAGEAAGVDLTYDLLIPREHNLSFEALFCWARDIGFEGLNITYPYKERVLELVTPASAAIKTLGAINTVRFKNGGASGFNTDHSGFMHAYRGAFGTAMPGKVCLIGCGGVGRAIGFALIELGATEIRCVDINTGRAQALVYDLQQTYPNAKATAWTEAEKAVDGAYGLLNCTALGMGGVGGQVLTKAQMAGARWAFDAVYTPVETAFLRAAHEAGLRCLSGFELFFWQGVDAWEIFSGEPTDAAKLRKALSAL
ncbi:MAG: shikimate dehydrogenase [Pseudomonadota bacterium]